MLSQDAESHPTDCTCEGERQAMWSTFCQCIEAMVSQDPDDGIHNTVASDIVGVGMGEQGTYYSKGQFIDLFHTLRKDMNNLHHSVSYGRRVINFHPPSSGTVISEADIQCVAGSKASVSHVVQVAAMHKRDGKWQITMLACAPFSYSKEAIEALPLRFAEGTLDHLRSEFRKDAVDLLTDSIPGGMMSFYNVSGYPLHFINRQMLEYLGYGKIDFEARFSPRIIELVHPDDRASLKKAIDDAVDSGREYELRHRLLKNNNEIAWVINRGRSTSVDASPVLMSVFTDVTEIISLQNKLKTQAERLEASLEAQKRQEERLQAAVAAAEEASKLKTSFLANMSHEIRTPMNGVVGYSDLALGEPSISERTRDYLTKIKVSAGSLLDVINDVLDISKIESGKMEIENVPFRLNRILEQCETIGGMRADDKGIKLVVEHDATVNPRLMGDPTRLRQVLINLLSNAIKFTERGSVRLTTRISDLPADRLRIDFEIADTGIGMSESQIQVIFDPFVQADSSTTRKYGGSGLGLPICKNFVELMGGNLQVSSRSGLGSKFSFGIDFAISGPTATDTHTLASSEVFREKRPIFSGTVLVCEDNQINQDVINEHLTRCGLDVDLAANGRQGVEMAIQRHAELNPYSVIFMDIHMPVMDGIEACRELLRQGVVSPVVALTANVMLCDREQYRATGMTECLSKPFIAPDLWTCLLKFVAPVGWVSNEATSAIGHDEDDLPVNRALGLQRSGGDPSVYARITANFLRTYPGMEAAVREAMATNRSAEALRMVHSVKGVSGTLGAVRLSRTAQALESALRDGLSSAVEELLKGFSRELDSVVRDLSSDRPRPDETVALGPGGTVDREAAFALLDRLEILLKANDGKAVELIGEIRSILQPLGTQARILAGQVEEYDFDDALDTITALRRML